MRRNSIGKRVEKWICGMGAAAMMFGMCGGQVHAEAEYECGAWVVDNKTEDCRTPICDGVHLTKFVTEQRHKTCTYLRTGYTFTIPETRVEEGGCCF